MTVEERREAMARAREILRASRLATIRNRRQLVATYRRAGWTAQQIADELRALGWGVGLTTIRRDIRALEGPRSPWQGTPAQLAALDRNRERRGERARRRMNARRRAVRAVMRDKPGLSASGIARVLQLAGLEVSEDTVERDVAALEGRRR